MNDFDQAARHAVKADPEGTLRWLFLKRSAKVAFSRWLDSQSAPRPGEPDRHCDTIAESIHAEGSRPPRVTVVELFTDADADALDRSLEYIGRFRREVRHGPYQQDRYCFSVGLIFLTAGPEELAWQSHEDDEDEDDEPTVVFRPKVRVLSRENPVALLEAIEDNRLSKGILAWVPLATGQTADVVAHWRRIVEPMADDNWRRTLIDIAIVFAELTQTRDLWKAGLKGLNMNESITMREVRNEGRQEGRQEGRDEGKVMANRRALIRLLESRNPAGLPREVHDRVVAETNPNELERWFDLALTMDLATFRAAIGA